MPSQNVVSVQRSLADFAAVLGGITERMFHSKYLEDWPDEEAVTAGLLGAFEALANEASVRLDNGIQVRATLTTKKAEKSNGMDAAIHFRCDGPEWRLQASVLSQAKRQEPGVPFCYKDHYRLTDQVHKMLDATPESFVVYSSEQGICAFPTASTGALAGKDLFEIGFSPWRTFLAGLLCGRFGDKVRVRAYSRRASSPIMLRQRPLHACPLHAHLLPGRPQQTPQACCRDRDTKAMKLSCADFRRHRRNLSLEFDEYSIAEGRSLFGPVQARYPTNGMGRLPRQASRRTTAMDTRAHESDLPGAFLIGSMVATGNPAVAELGLVGILLPFVLILLAFAVTLARGLQLQVGLRWIGAAYVAFIFLWYEQYKLLGDQGSRDLFTILTDWFGFHGYEAVMRIGVGLCEIVASLFILTPAVQGLGAIGAFMLMSGAIFFHLVTPLGVDPYNDGGVLFKEACSVWITSLVLIWWRRAQIAAIARFFGLPVPAWVGLAPVTSPMDR